MRPQNAIMNAIIFVTFTAEGFHRWSGATGHRDYLATRHRHIFNVKVSCETWHDDREIEFHDLRDQAKLYFGEGEFNDLSCEHMARLLAQKLALMYHRSFTVEVSEDGECGSIVRYECEIPI